MAIIVVGGSARKVGKTTVVAGLIAAMPEGAWTAVKVTQCHHGDDEACHCELGGVRFAMSEEMLASNESDTGRYLTAGAKRAFWVRVKPGAMGAAMEMLRPVLLGSNAIVESNSVMGYVEPDLYVCVLVPPMLDVKASAVRYIHKADALVLPDAQDANALSEIAYAKRIPMFTLSPDWCCSDEFVMFVRERVAASGDARAGATP